MVNQYKQENLLLSIVIPAYNSEKSISRTIDSLLKQSVGMDCYEIIVIDDGSTDATLAICQDIAKKNVNIRVEHQENSGASAARNHGIDLARGKWITFVDSDDYVMPYYVHAVITNSPEADYVIFDNYLEDAKGERKREKTWLDCYFNQACHVSQAIHWVCDQKLNAPWDKRFLLDVLKTKELRFHDSLRIGEDLLFNYQYLTHASTVFICSDCVYIHTDNPNGLCSTNISKMGITRYEMLYMHMLSASAEKEETIPYQKVIKQSFLRVIFRYAGQLFLAGWPPKEIAAQMDNSEMVRQILHEPVGLSANQIRQKILQVHLYWLCAVL